MRFAAFNPRKHSLLRGTVLVLLSLAAAFFLSGFPNDRPSPVLLVPVLLAAWGTVETLRCLQRHWSLYHGAVLVLLYSDLMALAMTLFLFLYPYGRWLL